MNLHEIPTSLTSQYCVDLQQQNMPVGIYTLQIYILHMRQDTAQGHLLVQCVWHS